MPTIAQGKRGTLMAGCSAHPSRVDFTLTPPSSEDGLPLASFPVIVDTGMLNAELLRIVDAITRAVQSVVRVAIGIQFLAVKPSSAEANSLIAGVIPSIYGVRITNEEDFIFQVNRPYVSSEAQGIKMNSITKWSVDRLQILTIALPMGGSTVTPVPSSPRPQTEQFIAAVVNFDINSVPSETPLATGQSSSLLSEALGTASRAQRTIGLNVEGF